MNLSYVNRCIGGFDSMIQGQGLRRKAKKLSQ